MHIEYMFITQQDFIVQGFGILHRKRVSQSNAVKVGRIEKIEAAKPVESSRAKDIE